MTARLHTFVQQTHLILTQRKTMLSLCGLVLLVQSVCQDSETSEVIDFYGADTIVDPKSASPVPDLQGLPPAAELLFRSRDEHIGNTLDGSSHGESF